MKVFSAQEMKTLETIAFEKGYNAMQFMEQAGINISHEISKQIEEKALPKRLVLLCGKGNNTGDGFVAAVHLLAKGFQIWAVQLEKIEKCSSLCQLNQKRFIDHGGKMIASLNDCPTPSLIIDAIFGTGFQGSVDRPYAQLIREANQSLIPIFSIDIPSGLNGSTGEVAGCAIHATHTLFLGLPKKGFFIGEGWNYVGQLQEVDFGLPQELVEEFASSLILLTKEKAASLLPALKRARHKYQAGSVMGLAGSLSMPGAAILSSLSALRAGSGIVKLFHPPEISNLLVNSPVELIKLSYEKEHTEQIFSEMQKAKAVFIGPGLGRTEEIAQLLKEIIPKLQIPTVLDADALFFLAENELKLPPKCILTPHLGEMQKLLYRSVPLTIGQELLDACQEYVNEKKVTLVLKGAPTFLFYPDAPVLISPTGNPGMATAGSGDVLTGLIASLLSQGLQERDAATLGVYLHGLAGDYASKSLTAYCLLASDIIKHFPQAFQELLLLKTSSLRKD